jgi:DNA-binding GntR family transcriptional regulator
MTETPISRGLLSDQVYERILASILDGSRAPGSRVVESEIARQLGISQAPVREAVKRLVHAGLVVSVPRQGSYVTEISPAELAIARTMRASIEAEAARIAAGEISSTAVARLRSVVTRMQTAVDADDWAAFRALDIEFHRGVIASTGLSVLARQWDTLEPMLVSQRAIGDPAYLGDRSRVVAWHADLIEVLVEGDRDAASAAFAEHASGAHDPEGTR